MGRKKKIRPEKECPRCGTLHIKRGVYCSYSCANVREHSELDKINKGLAVSAYHKTDAAEEHKWKLSHIARAAKQIKTDSTAEMPTAEDMEPPLPPDDYYENNNSMRSGRDIWYDAE